MNKIIIIAVIFILGAPAMAAGLMGGYLSYMFGAVGQTGTSASSTSIPHIGRVENAKNGRYKKEGFKSLLKFNDIEAKRRVSYTTLVDIGDLLKPDEKLPSPEFRKLFVEARSNQYGRTECERLKKILASSCLVKRSSNRVTDDPDIYSVTYSLAFVQGEPFGEVNNEGQVSYEEVLMRSAESVSWSSYLSDSGDYREHIYRKVDEHCNALRVLQGNCAISEIEITQSRPNKKRKITIRVNAKLSYLEGVT